ncbi:UrcA family protein [Sphingosinicella sp. BN140058]|uniref:UrcA family protein n=1 Tax=Sphingosinicella sp. BN140058 TaxID=1892855 RepID=UPI00101378AB|nr:UrcA family protein [Sphingosinicella sp. BN140058]QAY78119.1 UrcA family protein [Sphingosinicella sp. BN140058]
MTGRARAVLCALLLTICSVAAAETSTRVPLGGIRPEGPGDLARLKRRLAAAIETVCGSYAGASTSEEYEIKACRRAAIMEIDRQLAEKLPGVSARLARR